MRFRLREEPSSDPQMSARQLARVAYIEERISMVIARSVAMVFG